MTPPTLADCDRLRARLRAGDADLARVTAERDYALARWAAAAAAVLLADRPGSGPAAARGLAEACVAAEMDDLRRERW